jgi:hydrogenase nickel incorporation protein HypA/HybF
VHELSIADAIVAVACEHAGERRVEVVEVKIGRLRAVVPDALSFAFGLVAEGTAVEGAELRIEQVPARVACRECGAECCVSEFPFGCASCGSLAVDVIAGDELLVDSLELEEEPIGARR